jgi:hypothetical protein
MGAGRPLNGAKRRFPARAVSVADPAISNTYGYLTWVNVGLGRIIALYYRSSTLYQNF